MLLAGDIGGTKTVLALMAPEKDIRQPMREATYPSADYLSLSAIIAEFLSGIDIDLVNAASFGVAGPVIDEEAEITNLPWVVSAAAIGQAFNIGVVHLLNDLEAIANAVPYLQPGDLATLNQGTPEAIGAIAVIAPGTGLGEAFLTWDGHRYRAHPSEGGHASFAPGDSEQQALLSYLAARFGHVSCERVCSGSGIPNIYRFLRDSGRCPEPTWLREKLKSSEDPTPVIATVASDQGADICVETMRLFVAILANEASNMALKVLATGGVYLGGGIPPRILSLLQATRFMNVFSRKGRFTEFLSSLPIHVIRNPRTALYGAAYYGLAQKSG
jgi:glucokinase